MTTLTVNIPNEKDLPVLQEILNRFGLAYTVDHNKEFIFSKSDIEGLVKTKTRFYSGQNYSPRLD